jgi:hypothetical protein
MVAPRRTGVQDLSHSTILWQDLLRKTLVSPLVPAWGALVACLTGLVILTSARIYDLHYSTYTPVPGSVSIHILHTIVLDYGELLALLVIPTGWQPTRHPRGQHREGPCPMPSTAPRVAARKNSLCSLQHDCHRSHMYVGATTPAALHNARSVRQRSLTREAC